MAEILKGEIIQDAYSQATISGLTRSPTPEDLDLALGRLESMAAEFAGRNICVGWNFQDTPDPADDSGIELQFKQAFSTNLALRIMGDFGKDISQTLAVQAKQSMSNLSARTAQIRQTTYPARMPRGSGNTMRWNRWTKFFGPSVQAPQECATHEMQVGEVADFTESWIDYLNEGEVIASYAKVVTNGIRVTQDALTATLGGAAYDGISYRVEALLAGYQGIEFMVTTDTGRVDVRTVNFDIKPSATQQAA